MGVIVGVTVGVAVGAAVGVAAADEELEGGTGDTTWVDPPHAAMPTDVRPTSANTDPTLRKRICFEASTTNLRSTVSDPS